MIEVTLGQTPAGRELVRMRSSGEVSAADAESIKPLVGQGGKWEGKPILAVIEKGANYSPEARQAFGSFGGVKDSKPIPVAVVVGSAPLRVMLTFVIRISGAGDWTRFFGTEAEALAWLDQSIAAAS